MPITNRRIEAPEGSEFYPTPPVGTQIFLDLEEFTGKVWECACGDGAMSFVLEDRGYDVLSSDANDHGYGNRVDFLNSKFKVDNIVTNPPYLLAEQFIHHALRLAKRKVAMLLRLPFLEGSGRFERIYSKIPPARIYVFSSRLTFYKKKKVAINRCPIKAARPLIRGLFGIRITLARPRFIGCRRSSVKRNRKRKKSLSPRPNRSLNSRLKRLLKCLCIQT